MVLLPGSVPSAFSVAFWDMSWREDLVIEDARKTESGLVRRSIVEVMRKLFDKTFIE